MFNFYYTNTKTFDAPSASQPKGAITTYYKATDEELTILRNYVYEYFKMMEADFNECPAESAQVYGTKLKQHRKKNKKHYTVQDAINDLNTQLEGKDPTESMINRWNSAFAQLGHSDACIIVSRSNRPSLSKASKIPNELFNGLFEIED